MCKKKFGLFRKEFNYQLWRNGGKPLYSDIFWGLKLRIGTRVRKKIHRPSNPILSSKKNKIPPFLPERPGETN